MNVRKGRLPAVLVELPPPIGFLSANAVVQLNLDERRVSDGQQTLALVMADGLPSSLAWAAPDPEWAAELADRRISRPAEVASMRSGNNVRNGWPDGERIGHQFRLARQRDARLRLHSSHPSLFWNTRNFKRRFPHAGTVFCVLRAVDRALTGQKSTLAVTIRTQHRPESAFTRRALAPSRERGLKEPVGSAAEPSFCSRVSLRG